MIGFNHFHSTVRMLLASEFFFFFDSEFLQKLWISKSKHVFVIVLSLAGFYGQKLSGMT